MEKIPLLWRNALDSVLGEVCRELMQSHKTCQVSALAHLLVDTIRHFLGLVPLGNIRFDLSVDPGADFSPQGFVGFIVVGRVILLWSAEAKRACACTNALIPRWIGIRDQVAIRIHRLCRFFSLLARHWSHCP